MSELTKYEVYDQYYSTKTVWMYDIDEVDEVISTLKKKNERLLRELSEAHSKIVDLEAGEEKLKARVSELEKDIKRVIETYDAAIAAKGIENYAKALCTFIDSVKALKETANAD